MEGITILKVYDTIVDYMPGWSWLGFFIALAFLIVAIVSVVYMVNTKDYSIMPFLALLIITACFIGGIVFATAEPVYEKRQDIYIHGDINMDEFTSRYEIIEQDGLVFTVVEKSTD